MWQDLRQAVRTLRTHPGFVAVAALVLALGIGLNTAIFSIVHTMLFKPFPVEAPHELVSIYQVFPRNPDRPTVIFNQSYEFLEAHNEAFTGLTAHWHIPYTLRANNATDVVQAAWVLSNYFDVLGVRPVLGRSFMRQEDDVSNPERAVVIAHSLWTRRFRADPDIVGKQITLALSGRPDETYTIIGVMDAGFNGITDPWKPAQLWITFAQSSSEYAQRGAWSAVGMARLKPGVSFDEARAIVATQGRQWYYSRPSARPENEPRFTLYRTNDVRFPFDPAAALIPARLAGALTIVVAMVLLVAAINIAGILMARGVGRSGEIAIRRVLGASPLRIVRQLLAESMLLALAGGAAGFILAAWLLSLFRAFTPVQFAFDVTMDGRVVLFTTAVCVVAGIVVGLLPARQAVSLDVLPWLAGSGSLQTKPARARLRHAITLPQVALSLVLLLVAGVYVRALLRVELADLGHQPRNLLVATPVLRTHPGEQPRSWERTKSQLNLAERYAERTRRFYAQLLQNLRAIPGTTDVAIAESLPLREPPERSTWAALSQAEYQAGNRDGLGTEQIGVSPNYFRALGMVVTTGREFDERDTRTSPKVAVVGASVAQRLWPGRSAVGETLTMVNTWNTNEKNEWYEVVGVVNDVKPVLRESGMRPLVYLPLGQAWRPSSYNVLVRGTGDSRTLIPAVREAVARSDTFADVHRVRTMTQMIAEILYPRRIAAAVLAASGAIALFLATIGIYGVVSYSVTQRTGEIGVRMALGAERRDIVRLVLREGGTIALLGSLAGLVLGYTAIRITSSKYLALPQVDAGTVILTPLLLGAVVLLACYLPARRAGHVEPMDVLRRA